MITSSPEEAKFHSCWSEESSQIKTFRAEVDPEGRKVHFASFPSSPLIFLCIQTGPRRTRDSFKTES
ncbi:hypothetical protein AAC387_Pa02g3833 [Persea americana]